MRKPYNMPKKSEKPVEVADSREFKNQRTSVSYADRKWHKRDMRKPYNQ